MIANNRVTKINPYTLDFIFMLIKSIVVKEANCGGMYGGDAIMPIP